MSADQHTCGSCAKSAANVSWRIDPYMDEVYEEIMYRWLCDDCWQERKDEV